MREIEKLINGEVHTQDTVVVAHELLVHKVCQRMKMYASKVGQEYEDIVSVGFIGLIKAFNNFDPEKYDVRFSTYAMPMIQGEIQRALRDSSTGVKYSRGIKEIALRIREDELTEESHEYIADKLSVSKNKVYHAMEFIHNGNTSSIDIEIGDGETTITDVVGKEEDYTDIFVEDFLNTLNEIDKTIVNGLLEGRTQQEIGVMAGFSQVHVSRLIKNIRKKYLDHVNGEETTRKKQVMKVTVKGKPEITEEAVKRMKAEGMTYAAIAAHFGVSAPTLANRRQNWELQKTREARKNKVQHVIKDTESRIGRAELDQANEQIKVLENELALKIKTVEEQNAKLKEREERIFQLENKEDSREHLISQELERLREAEREYIKTDADYRNLHTASVKMQEELNRLRRVEEINIWLMEELIELKKEGLSC